MFKPKVLVSRCFFEAVRYDGQFISDSIVERLKPFIEAIPFCPEVEFGLDIPRPPIRIVKREGKKFLFQEETQRYLREEFKDFLRNQLSKLGELDGALLKSRSPSCGVGTAKLYINDKPVGKTDGFLAETIKEIYPYLPLEDEGRLKDKNLYYNFLTKIFALARFRDEVKAYSPQSLIEFHTKMKFLLKTFHQELFKKLGRLVGDGTLPFKDKIKLYEDFLKEILKFKADKKAHANTLYHVAGFFTKRISPKERHHLLNLIEGFRKGRLDLVVPLEVIRNLAWRFEEEYVLKQVYLNPFPEALS